MTSVRASGAMAERIVTVAAMHGEFRRLVPGLEVEGWSGDELREAAGLMAESVRCGDSEQIRAWQHWLSVAHGRIAAWVRYCEGRQAGTMARIWRGIEEDRVMRTRG